MAELINQEQSLTSAEIDDFEQMFCRELPDSFKSHYVRCNGGFPSEQDVEQGMWGLPVNGFYSIKYGKMAIESLIDEYGDITPGDTKFGSWRKFCYVPFAYDSGGNPIFISLRDDDGGSIYLYAQDGENIFLIAPSFDDFRARLYKEK